MLLRQCKKKNWLPFFIFLHSKVSYMKTRALELPNACCTTRSSFPYSSKCQSKSISPSYPTLIKRSIDSKKGSWTLLVLNDFPAKLKTNRRFSLAEISTSQSYLKAKNTQKRWTWRAIDTQKQHPHDLIRCHVLCEIKRKYMINGKCSTEIVITYFAIKVQRRNTFFFKKTQSRRIIY